MSELLATEYRKGLLSAKLWRRLMDSVLPTVANTFMAGQTFSAGIVLTVLGTDPSSPADGALWSRAAGLFTRIAGVTYRVLDFSGLATQAQAQAGTDTATWMSPARVKDAIVAAAIHYASTKTASNFTTSSGSFTDVTGLSVTIAPRSVTASVQINLSAMFGASQNGVTGTFQILRGSTVIWTASPAVNGNTSTVAPEVYDVPGDTTAQIYKLQIQGNGTSSYTVYAGSTLVAKDVG